MPHPRTPKLLKGALIEFSERFLGPIPNVIVFQYNPDTLTRALEVWKPSGGEASATAQPNDPPETFTLALELDASDALESPDAHPVASISGVADRIAAMEMLLYPQPTDGGLLGSLAGALSVGASVGGAGISLGGGSSAATATITQRGTVPVVLFAWGPGRIVPVRVTTFSVEETMHNTLLYPTRAKVSIGLKILTPRDFPPCDQKLSEKIAIASFKFTRKQKEILAAANMANSVESILGMLPF